jgi:hypothetical protein
MDNFVAWGAAWMFGGALLSVLVGVLIGRRRGAGVGAGSGLLLWGAGNLLVALAVVVYMEVDSTVVTLKATRCEPSADNRQRPMYTLYYAVQRPGEPAHEATARGQRGVCPESPMPVDALRLRKDALAGTAALIQGDHAGDDAPMAVSVTWGAFGVFAVFGASLLLAHGRGTPSRPTRSPGPVAPWRLGLGSLLSQLGLLLVLAALIGPHFLSGTTERAIVFGLRVGATALGVWIVAGLLAGTMTWPSFAFLTIFLLAMLGVGELVLWG